MRRLSAVERWVFALGLLFVGTGLWMVLYPRATTVVYQFYHPEDFSPDTRSYSLSASGLRLAGFGVVVVGGVCLWFARAGTRR
jgi:uncharacterized protein YjeT (DUF2065 family)